MSLQLLGCPRSHSELCGEIWAAAGLEARTDRTDWATATPKMEVELEDH